MAENSGIEWTTHTFNPWIGCTKISQACDHCYAEAWDRNSKGDRWGPHAQRTRTKMKNWNLPLRWNKEAEGAAERPRVFCASLADVFDNHRSIAPEWREDLWTLIEATPNLDWLLLTKRPQNITRFLPERWLETKCPDHVWLGATIENQEEYDKRTHHLTVVPARVHFLSMEPLLGRVNLRGGAGLDWIITGGESGAEYRPADPDWFRFLRDQCLEAGIPFLFKQWEGKTKPEIKAKGRYLDGVIHNEYPAAA